MAGATRSFATTSRSVQVRPTVPRVWLHADGNSIVPCSNEFALNMCKPGRPETAAPGVPEMYLRTSVL